MMTFKLSDWIKRADADAREQALRAELEFQRHRADERVKAYERQGAELADATDELVALRAEHARLQALTGQQAKEYTGRVAALQAQLTALHEALHSWCEDGSDDCEQPIDLILRLRDELAALRGPHV